ncbi:YpjP family protein [Evansella clarkii]|jgi:hypothetical protein|uniref:YpjP family protein n=1 Tax=Evansella clarkii TaxID=79879 RepID=UPI0009985173|nr:YpjP family protein [Evansella clarkii]
MKLWLKKFSVVLITFITLGTFIPPTYLDAQAENNDEILSSGNGEDSKNDLTGAHDTGDSVSESGEPATEDYVVALTELAKEQTIEKLGPRIIKNVEEEVNSLILPNIEEVLGMILTEAGEEVPYYVITEQPSGGYGEKIFNVYDYRSGDDIARFHVRRDNRPRDGYWFNFHYHLYTDNFEEHYELGEVYWDKNTPPKWMS